MGSKNFLLYACLPFVQLKEESLIQFGPLIFWPASKSEEFLGEFHPSFQDYIQKMGKMKVSHFEQSPQLIETGPLNPRGITCISIEEEIPVERREFLLIDALYLLYFACTFRHLYYGQEIIPFHPFRKMIPAKEEFIREKSNWENLHLYESQREETVSLQIIDLEICEALGKALEVIYHPDLESEKQELVQAHKRLVRSIRYLVDRFFQRFLNLMGGGLKFSEEIFEPEDIIFLASSFEALFNIESSQEAAADFKHKLRPLLHLKYSQPIEVFWKWVDGFYELKRRILSGDTFVDPLFRLNPNFEVSHILLAIKLFVYSVYYYLFTYQLLESTYVDSYTPPDFKWIHPEEILLFFWTEQAILEKMGHFIKQFEEEQLKEEILADMQLLSMLFVSLYDRYYLSEQIKGEGVVRFIPSPIQNLMQDGTEILNKLREMQSKDPENTFLKFVHPYFMDVLQDRLAEKKMNVSVD